MIERSHPRSPPSRPRVAFGPNNPRNRVKVDYSGYPRKGPLHGRSIAQVGSETSIAFAKVESDGLHPCFGHSHDQCLADQSRGSSDDDCPSRHSDLQVSVLVSCNCRQVGGADHYRKSMLAKTIGAVQRFSTINGAIHIFRFLETCGCLRTSRFNRSALRSSWERTRCHDRSDRGFTDERVGPSAFLA
jgi:hypothetical protein